MGILDDVKKSIRIMLLISLWMTTAACGRASGDVQNPVSVQGSGEAGATTAIDELAPAELEPDQRLRVLATTNILGDIVAQVGDAQLELTVLLPVGADPHGYTPTPGDLRMAAEAHLIFSNGFGLEANLLEALAEAAPQTPRVSISEGIQGLSFRGEETSENEGHLHTTEVDPHVWFDPANVKTWAQNVAQALSARDPAHTAIYQAHAQAYLADLEELDAWIQSQVQEIPQERRLLVSDHNVFQYFAARYGFEMVGAVIPAYSSTASVSAQEIADLIDVIQRTNVPAVFVGLTVNPRLAESIARDTGAAVVPLYIGSLSEPDGRAGSYLEMMRANVSAIVEALKHSG